MKTMICFILDRSGSMSGRESDVIGGVNGFIEAQKKLPDPACIALVRFDSEAIERFRPMQDLQRIEPLTASEFVPRGATPLFDAVGRTITQLDEDWRAEKPDRCIVAIVTDGQNNASREFTKDKNREMINAREGSGLWSFIYLGANVDAFEEAGGLGIAAANTANYTNSSAGIQSAYASVSSAVVRMRSTGDVFAHNLGGDIGEDGTLKKRRSAEPAQGQASATWTPPATSGNSAWTPPN